MSARLLKKKGLNYKMTPKMKQFIESLPINEWSDCPLGVHISTLIAAIRNGYIKHKFTMSIPIKWQQYKWGKIKRIKQLKGI